MKALLVHAATAIIILSSTLFFLGAPAAIAATVGAGFLVVRYLREKVETRAIMQRWQKELDAASALSVQLYENDISMGLLKDHGKWECLFQGKTLDRLRSAVADFNAFSELQLLVLALLHEARDAASHSLFPFVSSFKKGKAVLTTKPVTPPSRQLPPAAKGIEIHASAGVIAVPVKLLDEMSERLKQTHEKCSAIWQAFCAVEKNNEQIPVLLEEIKQRLFDQGLPLEPFQRRIDTILGGMPAIEATVTSDPLSASEKSEKLKAQVCELAAGVDRAIGLKGELASVEEGIKRVAERAQAVRGQKISYAYPLSGEETQPLLAQEELFRLTEDGGNPDHLIAQAHTHVGTALQAVAEGNFERWNEEKTAADKAAILAYQLIDRVLYAKVNVERMIGYERTRKLLSALQAALPRVEKQLAEVEADLPGDRYAEERHNVDRARQLIPAGAGQMASVKQDYDAQRYLAASAGLDAATKLSREASSALWWLFGQYLQTTVASCMRQAETLKAKLEIYAFTTSAATSGEYTRLLPILKGLSYKVERNLPVPRRTLEYRRDPTTQEVAAAEEVERLCATLASIDSAIDHQSLDHRRASEHLAQAELAIGKATDLVNQSITRQPARSKLERAATIWADVQTTIGQPQSNWAQLARRADEAFVLAEEARQLADVDRSLTARASAAIDSAQSLIDSLEGSSRRALTGELVEARTLIICARSAFASKHYEEAKEKGDLAYEAANRVRKGARRSRKGSGWRQ